MNSLFKCHGVFTKLSFFILSRQVHETISIQRFMASEQKHLINIKDLLIRKALCWLCSLRFKSISCSKLSNHYCAIALYLASSKLHN